MKKVIKTKLYKEFRCIADQCSFSCCEGWDINVDEDTYHKWNNEQGPFSKLCKNIYKEKEEEETVYKIRMGKELHCPFLDEHKLCNIIKDYGDDYLSNTCKSFPRIENDMEDAIEYSVSCACPAVVDMIYSRKEKIELPHTIINRFNDKKLLTYKIRQHMLYLIEAKRFNLQERILLIFSMLLSLTEESSEIEAILEKYKEESYLILLLGVIKDTEISREDSFIEKNELFLDITEDYKKEFHYQPYLEDIARLAEDIDYSGKTLFDWRNYEKFSMEYEELFGACLAYKIYSNCIDEDVEDIIMSYQLIVTEYIMVNYSVFLKWLLNKKKRIPYEEVRNLIVTYSRIIGYNLEGMTMFWEDSFDDAIWEFGYAVALLKD
ncbi:flagellin lysine-N-methylase [Anaeromicropila herbilytica]|uniref:Lysine-N-methylase n=1 Tax=Anaeromicropila herbilytica TaxID=2785025 RepID=A0A7R7EL41_9FIRM|nr:flagellin lysine-N-methylase [Anaeromicropila herbilytica]BCN30777.1 hypothetical protein bsdtb5_20720 [Anaeromicropila herbilytica]